MSRPANPYDNASCESFIKTLKREEIYANRYRNLEDLRSHIREFIDGYYNQKRLHSALGYQTPEEFEAQTHGKTEAELYSAALRFFTADPTSQIEIQMFSGSTNITLLHPASRHEFPSLRPQIFMQPLESRLG